MGDQSTDTQRKERTTLQQCLPKFQGQTGWALSNLAPLNVVGELKLYDL